MPKIAPLLFGLLVLQGCATASLENREWYEVRTEHFEITSSLSEARTLQLARDAELFHSAAEFVVRTRLPTPTVPTRIIAFDNRGALRPYAVRGAASYFRPTQRAALMVFRRGGGWSDDASPDVRHRYMHYLLESHGEFGKQLWFDEGFSQLMSTVDVRVDHVDIGNFRADYIHMLRSEPWLPLLKVIRTRSLEAFGSRKRPLFYAQSWALVHYLFFGQELPDRGREQLRQYAAALAGGATHETAIRRAFGRSSDELSRDLHKYIRGDRFDAIGVRFRKQLRAGSQKLRPLLRSEVSTRLGWLLMELERGGLAEDRFERALEYNPEATRAHAGMGAALGLDSQWDAALASLERAIELEPNEVLNHIDLARHYTRHAAASEHAGERAQLVLKARSQIRKALELDDTLPEIYVLAGQTYGVEGQDPADGVPSLEKAHDMLRADQRIKLELARMYFAAGRLSLARGMAIDVQTRTHAKPIRERAEELVEEIDAARATGVPGS